MRFTSVVVLLFAAASIATATNPYPHTFDLTIDYVWNFTASSHQSISKCFPFQMPIGALHAKRIDTILPEGAVVSVVNAWGLPANQFTTLDTTVGDDGALISCRGVESGFPLTQYSFVGDFRTQKLEAPEGTAFPFGNETGVVTFILEIDISYDDTEIVSDQPIGFRIKYGAYNPSVQNVGFIVGGFEDAMIKILPGYSDFTVAAEIHSGASYFDDLGPLAFQEFAYDYLNGFFLADNMERLFAAAGTDQVTLYYSLQHTNYLGVSASLKRYINGTGLINPNITDILQTYESRFNVSYTWTPPVGQNIATTNVQVIDTTNFKNGQKAWHKLNGKVLQRGDSLRLSCVFDTTSQTSVVLGGFDIPKELCNQVLVYGPAPFVFPSRLMVDPLLNTMGSAYVNPLDDSNFE